MPRLDNPRHELFAQNIARGVSQRESYTLAGYDCQSIEATDASASRLLSDVRISDRVAELLDMSAQAASITAERVLVEMGLIGFAALNHESVKVSDKRAALADIGKHLGMFKEKLEVTGANSGPIETADVSDLELARKVAFLLAKGKQAMEQG